MPRPLQPDDIVELSFSGAEKDVLIHRLIRGYDIEKTVAYTRQRYFSDIGFKITADGVKKLEARFLKHLRIMGFKMQKREVLFVVDYEPK